MKFHFGKQKPGDDWIHYEVKLSMKSGGELVSFITGDKLKLLLDTWTNLHHQLDVATIDAVNEHGTTYEIHVRLGEIEAIVTKRL